MLPLFGTLASGAAFNFSGPSLPGLFTLTRASTGTYWNGTALATASANVPRFDVAGGPSGRSGFLDEPQAMNLFLNSQAPATQSVATTAQTIYDQRVGQRGRDDHADAARQRGF